MVGADGGFDERGERRGIEKKEQPPRPVGGGAFACGSHFQTCTNRTNLGASLTVTRTEEHRRTHDRNQELFGKWGLGDANVGKWGFGDANVGKWGFGDANLGKWGFGARTWGSGASARKLPGKWGLGARTWGSGASARKLPGKWGRGEQTRKPKNSATLFQKAGWEVGDRRKWEVRDGRGKSSKWGPCRGEKFEVGDRL